jgi:hypothetical protein
VAWEVVVCGGEFEVEMRGKEEMEIELKVLERL